jgi:hypothetical protein
MKRVALVFLLSLVLAGAGLAVQVPLCGDLTPLAGNQTVVLSQYIGLGSSGCVIDDKLFYDFNYTSVASGGAVPVPEDGVGVNVIDLPFMPGLTFVAGWAVGAGQVMDSNIMYTVRVLDGGAPISSVVASMGGYVAVPDGIVVVAETAVPDLPRSVTLYYDGVRLQSSDVVQIAPTLGPIRLTKDISLNGNTGLAAVSLVTNQFYEVPEPAVFVLIGSGLLALAFVRRRMRG